MKRFLLLLKILHDTWMSPSSTTWATDVILASACGLAHFILLIPHLRTDLAFLLTGKDNIRKHHRKKNRCNKSRKKSCTLKTCRDSCKEVQDTQNLPSRLQSHPLKLRDKGRFHPRLREVVAGEVFKPGPARVQRAQRHLVEDPASSTVVPVPPSALATQRPLPQASTLSPGPREDWFNLGRAPQDTVARGSLLCNTCLAPVVRTTSDPNRLHSSLSSLSCWWATANAVFSPTLAQHLSQQDPPSHHPPPTSCWGDPPFWPVEGRACQSTILHIQRLPDTVIIQRVQLIIQNKTEKDGLLPKPVSTVRPLAFLGNTVRPLAGKRGTTSQPFCTTECQPVWLRAPQRLTYDVVMGDLLEQKESQLCWGLLLVQSENLVATAWLTKGPSSSWLRSGRVRQLPSPPVLQFQAKGLPQPSETQVLIRPVARPQLCMPNLPHCVPQAQTPARISCSLPDPAPSCPSQMKACTTICPPCQQEAQLFVPLENQQLACSLQKLPKHSAPEIPRAQEPTAQPTPNLPPGSQDAQAPKSALMLLGDSNSPEAQEAIDRPGAEGFCRGEHAHHPAVMSQAPQEGMQPQARFPGRGQGQTQGKQGPTTPSAPAPQNSTGVQKKTGSWRSGSPFRKGPRTFQLDQPGNVQQAALERDSRHQPHSSGRTPQQAQGDCDQHAQSDSVGPKTCDSGRHFFMGPGKKRLEKSPREHLGRKLRQTHEGMIPLCMRKSWLAAKHNFYNCNTRAKPRELACFKLQMASVNSWQELPFLHPKTRLLLEVQFQRACLKHRWGPLYGPFSP